MSVHALFEALGRISFFVTLVTGTLGMLFGAAGWEKGFAAVQAPFLASIILTLLFGGKEMDGIPRGRIGRRP